MGSGTIEAVAIKHKRKFIGIEKDNTYFKITQDRFDDIKKQLNISCFFIIIFYFN